MHGGRAEPVRLALAVGGVEFEDHRFAFPEFAEIRKTTCLVKYQRSRLTVCKSRNVMRNCVTPASWRVCILAILSKLCCAMK